MVGIDFNFFRAFMSIRKEYILVGSLSIYSRKVTIRNFRKVTIRNFRKVTIRIFQEDHYPYIPGSIYSTKVNSFEDNEQ
uniref:Ovule protein n=1 Tax=Parascaris univalens TaxID=6257 RepID=A0A915C2Z3_PARUN